MDSFCIARHEDGHGLTDKGEDGVALGNTFQKYRLIICSVTQVDELQALVRVRGSGSQSPCVYFRVEVRVRVAIGCGSRQFAFPLAARNIAFTERCAAFGL